MRGRGQEDQVDLVDDVLVGVEAGVLAVLGDIDARADGCQILEGREVIIDPVLEGVGNGDELGAGVGLQGFLSRAAAASAAADQADLDRAAARGMDHRHRQAGSCRRPAAAPASAAVEPVRKFAPAGLVARSRRKRRDLSGGRLEVGQSRRGSCGGIEDPSGPQSVRPARVAFMVIGSRAARHLF